MAVTSLYFWLTSESLTSSLVKPIPTITSGTWLIKTEIVISQFPVTSYKGVTQVDLTALPVLSVQGLIHIQCLHNGSVYAFIFTTLWHLYGHSGKQSFEWHNIRELWHKLSLGDWTVPQTFFKANKRSPQQASMTLLPQLQTLLWWRRIHDPLNCAARVPRQLFPGNITVCSYCNPPQKSTHYKMAINHFVNKGNKWRVRGFSPMRLVSFKSSTGSVWGFSSSLS